MSMSDDFSILLQSHGQTRIIYLHANLLSFYKQKKTGRDEVLET